MVDMARVWTQQVSLMLVLHYEADRLLGKG
jgi:hypothetical protein